MAAEAGAAAAPQVAQQAGQAAGEFRDRNRGVLLALAIVLLWLAGVAFFFAFEGLSSIEQADTSSGGGIFKALIGGLADKAQAQEKQNSQGGQ